MSIAPKFLEAAKLKARLHLQIEVDQDADAFYSDFRALGYSKITGTGWVRRIFKGGDTVAPDEKIAFSMRRSGPSVFSFKPLRLRDFDLGEFVEVYMNGESPIFSLDVEHCYSIEQLTTEPTNPVNVQLAREAAANRWRVPLVACRDGRAFRFNNPAVNDD